MKIAAIIIAIATVLLLLISSADAKAHSVYPTAATDLHDADTLLGITEACLRIVGALEPVHPSRKDAWERQRRVCALYLLLDSQDNPIWQLLSPAERILPVTEP